MRTVLEDWNISAVEQVIKDNVLPNSAPSTVVRSFMEPRLPDDLLFELAAVLGETAPSYVLNIALLSRRIFHLVAPVLFQNVVLQCNDHVTPALKFLKKRKDLLPYVKVLVVRPNQKIWTLKGDWNKLDEDTVIRLIEKLAPLLANLSTFVWDGKAFPAHDDIWLSLRKLCPKLKNLGTVIREFADCTTDLFPYSQMFRFTGLQSFSLTIRVSRKRGNLRRNQAITVVSPWFWRFLADNNTMKSISLNTKGFPYILGSRINIAPLLQARYDQLCSLSFGNFRVLFDSTTPNSAYPDLERFLTHHQTLESLAVCSYRNSPTEWPVLPSLRHLRAPSEATFFLRETVSSITDLHLPWCSLRAWDDPDVLFNESFASGLTSLTTFLRSSDLHEQRSEIEIILALKSLRFLEVSSRRQTSPLPGVFLDATTRSKLQTLKLTMVAEENHQPERTKSLASDIYRHNPHLRHLTLRYTEKRQLSGDQSGDVTCWSDCPDLPLIQVAKFDKLQEFSMNSITLAVQETLVTKRSKKSTRYYSIVA